MSAPGLHVAGNECVGEQRHVTADCRDVAVNLTRDGNSPADGGGTAADATEHRHVTADGAGTATEPLVLIDQNIVTYGVAVTAAARCGVNARRLGDGRHNR